MWLPVAILGNTILAVVAIIDKFILSKSVAKPAVFVFYSTIFILPFFLILPFGLTAGSVAQVDYIIFAISGGSFALGLWTMYTAIERSEISRIGPFIGALVPLCILFLGKIFLDEQLGANALVGALCLIGGSLFISLTGGSKAGRWDGGLVWAMAASLLFAVSHVSAKYVYDVYGFFSGFIFTKLPVGVCGALLLFNSDVRSLFNKKSTEIARKKSKKNPLLLVAFDMVLGVAATVLLQYAISLGSVSLVNALAGVQYGMLIVLTALISKLFPQVMKEDFSLTQIIYKSIAVIVVAVGLFFLILK